MRSRSHACAESRGVSFQTGGGQRIQRSGGDQFAQARAPLVRRIGGAEQASLRRLRACARSVHVKFDILRRERHNGAAEVNEISGSAEQRQGGSHVRQERRQDPLHCIDVSRKAGVVPLGDGVRGRAIRHFLPS